MIAIVKYNAGNISSVANALSRLNYNYVITDNATQLRTAEKVILPGVGAAAMAMEYLKEKRLDQIIRELEQPVLGICLGLQLLCKHSEEGNVDCIGVFNTLARKLPLVNIVPHMGWNSLLQPKGRLFSEISPADDVYFVHSYAAELCEDTIAICDYIQPFSAALNRNNFYATQFHPEKSSVVGDRILNNFLRL